VVSNTYQIFLFTERNRIWIKRQNFNKLMNDFVSVKQEAHGTRRSPDIIMNNVFGQYGFL